MEKHLNVDRAVAVQSGTVGLHLAMRALGVDREDEIDGLSLLPFNQAYQIEKAQHFVDHLINIPCSSSLTEEEVEIVVEWLKEFKK